MKSDGGHADFFPFADLEVGIEKMFDAWAFLV